MILPPELFLPRPTNDEEVMKKLYNRQDYPGQQVTNLYPRIYVVVDNHLYRERYNSDPRSVKRYIVNMFAHVQMLYERIRKPRIHLSLSKIEIITVSLL